ncbi:hypothetical protein LTR17_024368 [Elasticomyces elasticus]|nr:hypothetical protein LTR17_024368 [Elasticomyces elasticus]
MKLTATELRIDSGRKPAILLVIFLAMVLAFPLVIGNLGALTQESGQSAVFCYPDGSVRFAKQYHHNDPSYYPPWGEDSRYGLNSGTLRKQAWMPSLFLSITLGFGAFTFPEAKAIDVAWDLIIGRGAQFLLTMLAYPVVRKVLLYTLESKPVSFHEYSSIAFDSSISATSLYPTLLRRRASGLFRPSSTRYWLRFAVLLIGAYLLLFPTIVSTMTGYQSAQQPVIKDPSNPEKYLNVSNLIVPDLVVKDGERLKLDSYQTFMNNTKLTNSSGDLDILLAYGRTIHNLTKFIGDVNYTGDMTQYPWATISLLENGVINFTSSDPLSATRPTFQFPRDMTSIDQISSTINLRDSNATINLLPPPLSVVPNSYLWAVTDAEQYVWVGDARMTREYLTDEGNAICQPGKTYQWGFSFAVLLMFAIMTASYSALLIYLDWHVYTYSRADRYKHSVSVFRDVLDLAQELQDQLGSGVMALTGEELDTKVKEFRGSIQLDTEDLTRSRQHFHAQARRRIEDYRIEHWEANIVRYRLPGTDPDELLAKARKGGDGPYKPATIVRKLIRYIMRRPRHLGGYDRVASEESYSLQGLKPDQILL